MKVRITLPNICLNFILLTGTYLRTQFYVYCDKHCKLVSLTEKQYVVTQTIHQTVGLKRHLQSKCRNYKNCFSFYRGADKSLGRPGKKQARKHVRDARGFNNVETRAINKFFPLPFKARCRKKFTLF